MDSTISERSKRPVVIVTGASRGIGLAIVTALLKEMDACVLATSRQINGSLTRLETEFHGRMRITLGDIFDRKTSQEAVQAVKRTWGYLDGVVLNAGVIEPMGTIASVPVDDSPQSWRNLFEVNFFSLIHTIQASLSELRKSSNGARIVMVSSGSSVKGYHGTGPYGASKAAMNSLVRTLAVEEPTITTLAFLPGPTDTDMQGQIRSTKDMHPSDVNYFIDMHASKALLPVDKAGRILASLVLSAPTSMSGKCLSIDDDECAPFRPA